MRRRAFPGFGPDVAEQYHRSAQWLLAAIYHNDKAAAWCERNGLPLTKATSEGIGPAGGVTVPPDLANAILDLRDRYGAFRRGARLVPMASDSTSVARRPGGTGAFFIGEGGAATQTTANPDGINLTAKKIGSLVLLSNELEEDAAVDIVDFVANEIALAFAAQEDDCAFNGDGTSAFGKMRGIGTIVLDGQHAKAKVTASVNLFSTLSATDIGNLVGAVRASAVPNAAWYCSQTCLALTFMRIVSTGGGYMDSREVDGVITPYYLGFPVFLSPKMPLITTSLSGKMMLAFGDMHAAGVLGQRRGITIARSEDRYFDSDQIGVLGTQRFHAVIHDIGDNTNFGSIAALVGS
jgi:HK97 family phage major capsid protein